MFMPADVLDSKTVEWFWGLTCDFWAKNGKEILMRRQTVQNEYFRTLDPNGNLREMQQQIPFGNDNQKGKATITASGKATARTRVV
jgi:hypothetical protein